MFDSQAEKDRYILKQAWLGLDDNEFDDVKNILLGRSDADIDNPQMHLVRLLRKPENFYLTCKYLLNIQLLPLQCIILQELWKRPFPILSGSRGFSKSFLLAILAYLKCLFVPGTKIVTVGAAFRQSKVVFEYMETIWHNAPILRDICDKGVSGPRRETDRCVMHVNDSWMTAIPIGDGAKVRGLRAHTIFAEEFNSMVIQVYETVVAGFSVVSQDPIQNVKDAAIRNKLKEKDGWSREHEEFYQSEKKLNQQILSGTCGYDFEPFADYWKKYKTIIESRGDPKKLTSVFPNGMPTGLSYKDFSIIRVPHDLVPEGFMDSKQIERSRATVHTGIFTCEYGACFAKDSNGFFKRSIIDACVGTDIKPVQIPNGELVWFDVLMRGQPKKRYIYGIDPASEADSFAIVVLELYRDHARIVYGWSSNKKDFIARQKTGLIKENDFYSYCVRKIRELMKVFPCERIGIDGQGGGSMIIEGLHDPDKKQDGEDLLWEIVEDDKEKDTDTKSGQHILEKIEFARAEWTSEANNGLRKDMEDRAIIFPMFDPVSLALAAEEDNIAIERGDVRRKYDSLEDATFEIEELKHELSTIVQTKTSISARDRWDTPEIKLNNGRKGRMRKDRYSALVIANMLARQWRRGDAPIDFNVIGGNLRTMGFKKEVKEAYSDVEWLRGLSTDFFGGVNWNKSLGRPTTR
jgi:hypothetical protein